MNFPRKLNIEFTNYCNLRCLFCLNSKPFFRARGYMDENLFNRIIEEAPSKTKMIICGIGEPTLHPNFEQFVETMSNKFEDIELVTNGHFNEELIEIILKSNIKKTTFSLDYFSKTEYENNKHGDLEKVKSIIVEFINKRSRKQPIIQINMLAEKGKNDQIKEAILFFTNILGDDDFIYSRNIKSLAGQVDVDNIQIRDWLEMKRLRDEISKDVNVDKYRVENWVDFLNLKDAPKERFPCRHPFIYAMILFDGRTTFCCNDYNAKMVSGDLKHNTIEEIWKGEEYSNFRECMNRLDFKKYPLCYECDDWYKQQ